jgi:hypothetical protein
LPACFFFCALWSSKKKVRKKEFKQDSNVEFAKLHGDVCNNPPAQQEIKLNLSIKSHTRLSRRLAQTWFSSETTRLEGAAPGRTASKSTPMTQFVG